MTLARLKTSGVDVRLALSRALSPERRQQIIAAHAREGIREAQEANRAALGRVPPHDTFVDGRPGAVLESVNPDRGVILARFSVATEMFEWIEAMLIRHSPVRSGRYAKSHVFFADGKEADPANPPAADVYVFLNTQPYSRKIERGLSKKALEGVYATTAALAARRFGNVARIRLGYRAVQNGALASIAAVSELRRTMGRREAHLAVKRERDLRQPAIIVAMN